jgi:two-component system sensor histidine kinase LytS
MSENNTPFMEDTYPYNIYKGQDTTSGATIRDCLDKVLYLALSLSVIIGLIMVFFPTVRTAGLFTLLALLTIMLVIVIVKRRMRPDEVLMRQSDHMIAIAIRTTSLLRQGLTEETAMEACSIILDELPSIDAVALTNSKRVLGYAGFGCIHHQQWRFIKSAYSKACLRDMKTQVVSNIECIDSCCPLKSAIIVPLILRDQAVGTLKFYYADVLDLTEDERAMTESLAGLVSVQLEVHELEKESAFVREMELKMLQAQIDPHFLFNTLNTIASLTRTDPQTARDLISNLAQFYRYTLEGGTKEETLQEAVDMVLHYFDLEQARFGERLRLYLEIDEDLYDLQMPRFMLQPLVENSIKHGMRPDGSRLTIRVTAEDVTDGGEPAIRISVTDDGKGFSPTSLDTVNQETESEKGLGLALHNIRGQLRHYYGLSALMDVVSEEGVGTEVTYRIPYEHSGEDIALVAADHR